jgi:hypothetical protein
MPNISAKLIAKEFKSGRNLLTAVCVVVLASFWFDLHITIPKGLDLPILGGVLGGRRLDRDLAAQWLPAVLFIIYGSILLRVISTNYRNELVRRIILELSMNRNWRFINFSEAVARHYLSTDDAWLVEPLLHLDDQSRRAISAELSRESVLFDTAEFVETDFERRIYNLHSCGHQKHYLPAMMCLDPLMYVMNTNRLRWAQYNVAVRSGLDARTVTPVTNPDAVDMSPAVFIFIYALNTALFAALIGWSFLLLTNASVWTWLMNAIAAFVVIALPPTWSFFAILQRWGFPVGEPIGAYTVGPLTPNQLSIP